MKIAIVSDLHLGDPMSRIWGWDDKRGPVQGDMYDAFANAVGQGNRYLILLGDILDFSIRNYKIAFEVGRAFFKKVHEDGIAQEFIYVAGNHDFGIWHTVEYQVNIINKIRRGEPIELFRHSVPGLIDDRTGIHDHDLKLANVTAQTVRGRRTYGGLFLDYLIGQEGNTPLLKFNFAYPNLYLVTREGQTVLITHGQYLETYYALAGELARRIARCDLFQGEEIRPLILQEIVSVNFPLNQLACTGIGQAGPLTKVIRDLQREVKDDDLRRIKKYSSRLYGAIADMFDIPWYKKLLLWPAFRMMKWALLSKLRDYHEARFDETFLKPGRNRDYFIHYYRESVKEIENLEKLVEDLERALPIPEAVIFGHTHVPFSWEKPMDALDIDGKTVRPYNAGGWLNKKDGDFVGAEVFTYDTDSGLGSISIQRPSKP